MVSLSSPRAPLQPSADFDCVDSGVSLQRSAGQSTWSWHQKMRFCCLVGCACVGIGTLGLLIVGPNIKNAMVATDAMSKSHFQGSRKFMVPHARPLSSPVHPGATIPGDIAPPMAPLGAVATSMTPALMSNENSQFFQLQARVKELEHMLGERQTQKPGQGMTWFFGAFFAVLGMGIGGAVMHAVSDQTRSGPARSRLAALTMSAKGSAEDAAAPRLPSDWTDSDFQRFGPGGAVIAHNLLSTRRTINDFCEELPENWEESLLRAIRAATYAPNHKRTEPWRFHLLGPEAIRRVCELNAEMVTAKKGEAAGEKKLKRWLKMPGWLIATCKKSEGTDSSVVDMSKPDGVVREDYAACCCAVQNLCLSLHADGIGTKWTSGAVNFDSRFATAADLPADEYVVGTIWFGTAAKQANAPRKALSLGEVLTRHA